MFGDGHDYDWALVDDEENAYEAEQAKPEMKYQDVRSPHLSWRRVAEIITGLRTLGNPSTLR